MNAHPHSNEPVAGIVLAAGLSTRMGRSKQLLQARGRILLAHVLEPILRADLDPIVLVLGYQSEKIKAALSSPQGLLPDQLKRLRMVFNPDFKDGQAGSIRCGLSALPPLAAAALFLPGDQFGLSPEIINHVTARFREADQPGIVRPRYGLTPGSPVLFARRHFPALNTLKNDQGGRSLLKCLTHDAVYLDLPENIRPLDIDTESDYQSWRQMLEG